MATTYSVITVCLNAAATLDRTMRSVLCQEPPPNKYVVVDGGSTDGTREVFDACVASHHSALTTVTWVDQGSAAGIAHAWNLGITMCTESLVFILNSDDWYESGCAASVIERFDSDPSIDVLCGTVRLVPPDRLGAVRSIAPRSCALFPVLLPFGHPAVFVRRDVYQSVGMFDCRYAIAADYDFIYRCKVAGCKFLSDPSIVVNQQGGGLASRSRSTARREVRDIGLRHSGQTMGPWVAYVARIMLGR